MRAVHEQCTAPRVLRPPPSSWPYPCLVLGGGLSAWWRLVVPALLDGAVDHPHLVRVRVRVRGRVRVRVRVRV